MAIINRLYSTKIKIIIKESYENATNPIIHDHHLVKSYKVQEL